MPIACTERHVALVTEMMPPRVIQEVSREIEEFEWRSAAAERRRKRRIEDDIPRDLPRAFKSVGDPLIQDMRCLVGEADSCISIRTTKEGVGVRPPECSLARRARSGRVSARDPPQSRPASQNETKIEAAAGIAKIIINALVVGVKPRIEARVVEAFKCSSHIDTALHRVVFTGLEVQVHFGTTLFRRTMLSEDLHNASHGIGAEQRRLRTTHDFNVINSTCGKIVEVIEPARFVQRYSIEQELRVVALASAQEK